MEQHAFDELVADVAKHFPTPEALLARDDLTREQKLALLRQWEYDLHLMQVATEENMTSNATPGNNAERLRQVRAAATKLGAKVDEGKATPSKTGTMPELPPEKAKNRR